MLKVIILFIFIFPISSLADENLKEGEILLKEGQYAQAKDFFRKYIEDPNLAPNALLGMGKSEYFLENYPEATLYLRRLLRDFKDSIFVNEANLYLGLSYLKQGKYRDAEFYLKNVKNHLEPKARIGIGWIYFYRGDTKALESIIHQIDNQEIKDNPEAALLRIKYLVNTDKVETGLKEFEKNPKLKKYEIDKAEILLKANRYDEAEKILKKIISQNRKLMEVINAKYILFDLYFLQGKVDEALKIAREILLYSPPDNFKIRLFSIYLDQNNNEEAFKILITLRDRNLKLKKLEEFVNNAIKKSPEKASEYIMKTYTHFSNDSFILMEWADFLIKNGKINEAKNLIRKVQSGPRKSEATLPYAQILIKEGKIREAKKILEPIRYKKPLATALYAQVLFIEGDRENALKNLRNIITKINDPDILELTGDLEYSIGDKKKAIKHWTDAARTGKSTSALKAADYYYLNKNLSMSTEYYKKAIDLGLKDNDSLMWAYYQFGKITKNKSYLEKVANSENKFSHFAREMLEKL